MLDSDPPTAGDKLLRLFDSDPLVAAHKLLRCRQKLIRRFAGERLPDAEDLANETLRRVLQSLELEERKLTTTIEAYVSGFATNVIHEFRRQQIQKKEIPLDDLPSASEPRSISLEELELAFSQREDLWICLKQCLNELSRTDRETLVRYYDTQVNQKLKQIREQIARSLGLSSSQLRKHTFKLRATLEACIRNCLSLGTEFKNRHK